MPWWALASGDAVEVLSDNGGAAAWRPARLIQPFITCRLHFVAFDDGAAGDAFSARDTVPADSVRPRPDSAAACGSGFELHQLVEAKLDGVWRPGVVSKVQVVAGRERRYGVRFPRAAAEVEFRPEEVRARLDLVDGQWVSAEEKSKHLLSGNIGVRRSSRQRKPLYASNTSRKRKVPGSTTALSRCGDAARGQVSIFTPNPVNENADRSTFQSQPKLSQPCKKARKGETIEDNMGMLDLREREFSASKSGFDVHTPIVEEEPQFHIKSLVGQSCSSSPFMKMNVASVEFIAESASNILLENPLIQEKLSQEDTPVCDKGEELPKDRPANSEFLQISEWCQHRGIRRPSQQREELVHQCEQQRDEGVRQYTSRERRRKNSRPQKVKIVEPSLEGDSMRNLQDSKAVSGLGPVTECGKCSVSCLEREEVMVGSSDASLVETSSSGVIEKAGNSFEPRLDKSPEGQSPWPFKKSSSVWDSIKSMEAFSIMPQCPHFRPLEQFHKDFREGMAIGLMVTFSNLFNSISKLQIADSRHKFDDLLNPLVSLETYGFDVQCLRAHLEELLRMKENQERLVDEKSALEVLLVKRKREKDRLDSELKSIEKACRELEQSLSILLEQKVHISEQIKENDSNLDKLEMDSRGVEQAILSTEHDFDAIISSKW